MSAAKSDIKNVFSNNIKYLLNQNHKTRKEVCNDLNIKYTTFCDWANGRIIPKYENLEKLGRYFNVDTRDFFIDIEENNEMMISKRLLKYANTSVLNSKELDMNILRDLNDEQIKELINAGFSFKHKSYEERLAECGGVAQPYKFDWGEPKGREIF